jgi:hypothetical protein
MALEQFMIEELLLNFDDVPQNSITIDFATRCKEDKFKVLLQFSKDFPESWAQTYKNLKNIKIAMLTLIYLSLVSIST